MLGEQLGHQLAPAGDADLADAHLVGRGRPPLRSRSVQRPGRGLEPRSYVDDDVFARARRHGLVPRPDVGVTTTGGERTEPHTVRHARGRAAPGGRRGRPCDANSPTVVLLHGGGQARHSWSGTWGVLVRAGWRAWSVDLRGHGDSDWAPDGDYSLDGFAGDVLALATSLPRPPVLVGASLGGLASLVAVAESPEQRRTARAVVLVDVAHKLEESGRERIGAFMSGNLDGFASAREAADAIAAYLAPPAADRPVGPGEEPAPPSRRPLGLALGPGLHPGQVRLGRRDPLVGGRSRSPRPGRRRPTGSHAAGAGPQQRPAERGGRPGLPGPRSHAEFADVAGAGHMVAGDRNEVFNHAILDFLARHRR